MRSFPYMIVYLKQKPSHLPYLISPVVVFHLILIYYLVVVNFNSITMHCIFFNLFYHFVIMTQSTTRHVDIKLHVRIPVLLHNTSTMYACILSDCHTLIMLTSSAIVLKGVTMISHMDLCNNYTLTVMCIIII